MEEVTLNKHHEMVMDKLHDIDEDTECILKELGGKEMSGDFDSGALMGMLANKGVDPGVIAMLENCRKDGSWGDNKAYVSRKENRATELYVDTEMKPDDT